MLEILRIKNIAIIDAAEVTFKKGLNIISGETGAGKSIVIEAISLLLGGRASTELIRAGCDEAMIEGLFSIADIPWMKARLETSGFDSEVNDLLIKRSVHRSGKHRISVNGELATLSTLQKLCEGLIDLCGQHEHQSLLKSFIQLELLDRYGGLDKQTQQVSTLYTEVRKLSREVEELRIAENELNKRRDFLKFQIEEIKAAELLPNEDEELHREKQLLQSVEARLQSAEGSLHALEGKGVEDSEEESAIQRIRYAHQKLRFLAQMDPRMGSVLEGLQRALAEVEDVSHHLNRYLGQLDLDPNRLQSVQERLSQIADLRRKYGSTVNEILSTLEKLETEFESLNHLSQDLSEIAKKLAAVENEFYQKAEQLSQARREISETFSTLVTLELKDLKMNQSQFLIELILKEDRSDWNSSGGDLIQFLVQTNAGEPMRPIAKIASGGELSRLMLVIRRVISNRGGIGVYLFDEIDSGMGGQTAFEVGRKLKSVSEFNQVICITHLPQVASFADHHLVVQKSVVGKRTLTEVRELRKKDRKEEIARMLGGPVLSRNSLANAAELLSLASR